jgi:drug/metabolite transporter (DMT)-like permease
MQQTNNFSGMTAYLTMILTIVSVTFYQVFQKEISAQVNPFASLIITYLVAIIISLIFWWVYPGGVSILESIKSANYASYLLGITIVGIELGFLLIYRAGWKIGVANIFSSSVSAVLLLFIGMAVYREHLTLTKLLGIGLCIAGLMLLNRK